jgi:hypothetical protein
MTNGSVGDLVVSNGRVLTVNYKGGQQKILVPEDVPIVNLMPGIGFAQGWGEDRDVRHARRGRHADRAIDFRWQGWRHAADGRSCRRLRSFDLGF